MKKTILLFNAILLYCFLSNISYTQTPNWLWAKSAGGTNVDAAWSVALDASGNIYVAGQFESPTITFGPTTLTNTGVADMFLAKYDASGNVLWAKNAGGTGDDAAVSVTVDASGSPYVAGHFRSATITFGSTILTNAGAYDIFLAKYDVNGNVLWARSACGTGYDKASSVAADASGNVYIAGKFISPVITFGSFTLTNTYPGGDDMFLAKYDVNGNVRWARSAGGTYIDDVSSVAVNASGNIYIAGYFQSSTLNLGSISLTNAGQNDMFLAKYNANGNVRWAKSAGGIGEDKAWSVAVDASGNIYVTGAFISSTITFGSISLTNAGQNDMFLAKYNADGDVLWAKSAVGNSLDVAYSVALDASGNAYVAGRYMSFAITFGSCTLWNPDGDDEIFLAKYDANGNVPWAKNAGGIGEYEPKSVSVAMDASGNGYVTGQFGSPTITFGSTMLTNTGAYDIFLAKLGSNAGINEMSNLLKNSVFPNPATDKITIETSEILKHNRLSILNLNGQELITRRITGPKTQLDISTLPSGVYFVRVTGERAVQVGKFIKQ